MHWESGMHEDYGRAIPWSIPISKVASSYTEAEFVKWTTGSTWSRSKKIFRPPKRIVRSYVETCNSKVDHTPWKTLIWENQHHSLTMFIWIALNENVKQARILRIITKVCSNPGFMQDLLKSNFILRNLMQSFSHGPMIWKVMQGSAWKDIANLRLKQVNNRTWLRRHVWMTTNFLNRRKWISWKIVHSLLTNCCKMFFLAHIGRPDYFKTLILQETLKTL